MIIFQELPSLRSTQPNRAEGKMIFELQWVHDSWIGLGWRRFNVGIYRVNRLGQPGEYAIQGKNISGFRWSLLIWLPWVASEQ